MPKQKKQHFVPKCYLKNFANNKNFSIFMQNSQKIIENVPYTDQCQSSYFYGQDLIIENNLQQKESLWGSIFHKIINEIPLTLDDEQNLKLFALYQRIRTKAENDHVNNMGRQVVDYINNFNSKYPKSKYYLHKDISPAEYFSLVNDTINKIDDLDLLIIDYKTKTPLISSDAPVILINPFFCCIGLAVIGLVIFFPVNKNKLVVFYDSKTYPNYKGKTYIQSFDEKEVHHLNNAQYIMSDEIIFSQSLPVLYTFGGKIRKLRQRNIERNIVDIMGNKEQQIIHHSARKLYYEYEFSFAKLPKYLKQIPNNCRDMLPRIYDENWAERIFSIKPELFINLYKKGIPDIPDVKNKKELIQGFNAMKKFMYKYWNMQSIPNWNF